MVYHTAADQAPQEMVTNSAIVDEWTKVHVLSGVVTGLLGIRPVYAGAGAVVYELLEYAHEWPSGSKLFGSKRPESFGNVASDLVVFALGYAAGHWLRGGRSTGTVRSR